MASSGASGSATVAELDSFLEAIFREMANCQRVGEGCVEHSEVSERS